MSVGASRALSGRTIFAVDFEDSLSLNEPTATASYRFCEHVLYWINCFLKNIFTGHFM